MDEICFTLTPWKINMEPTNHPFRKRKWSSKPPLLCSMLIFRGVCSCSCRLFNMILCRQCVAGGIISRYVYHLVTRDLQNLWVSYSSYAIPGAWRGIVANFRDSSYFGNWEKVLEIEKRWCISFHCFTGTSTWSFFGIWNIDLFDIHACWSIF